MDTKWTRHLGTGAIALLSVLAVGAAALFSSADQARRVAADSQRLKAVQIAVAETATHRAALVITFASDQAESELGRQAIREAVAAAERIETQLTPLTGADQLRSLAQTLTESTRTVESSLAADGEDVARLEVERSTLPAVGALAQALSSEAAAIGGRIDAEQAEAGRIAQAASFVVALISPILAVVMVRARAKRRLERSQLESEVARQKELAETRDRLIAGMSHQLRTPLTAIYGWADLVSNQPSAEVAEEGSMAILEQAGELRRMVDDILVSARLDVTSLGNRPTPTPIDRIVEGAIRHFRRVGAEIKVDCEATVVTIDAARLQHALHNLVSNSLLHGDGAVELIGKVDGDRYRLAVCDSGSGLPVERQADPFAAFAHAPENITTANSLGLGLSVAKALIDLIGGDLTYERRDPRTVFAISVPISPPEGSTSPGD